jgi:hypothetical protein
MGLARLMPKLIYHIDISFAYHYEVYTKNADRSPLGV